MKYFEETIGEFITGRISALDVDITLSEEETGEYPYVTYENDITPRFSKDGLEAYRSSTALRITSDNFDEAESIADTIMAALSEVTDGNFAVQFERRERDRSAAIWTISLYYIIMQYSNVRI